MERLETDPGPNEREEIRRLLSQIETRAQPARAGRCRPAERGMRRSAGCAEGTRPYDAAGGEARRSGGDVFASSVYDHCTESFWLGELPSTCCSVIATVDLARLICGRRANLPLLICKSEEAIQTFIAHCGIAARDLLMPYGDVVMVVSIVLRIKPTLDGGEVDEIVRDVVAGNGHPRSAVGVRVGASVSGPLRVSRITSKTGTKSSKRRA